MKKGFTLIELIGVIVIIALITLLALPPLLSSVRGNKKTISETSKRTIYSATDLYVSNNTKSFPRYEGSVYCVTLGTLVNDGTLTSDIYSNGVDELDSTKTVKLTVKNGIFEKEIVNVNECNKHIIITIKKEENRYISSYLGIEEGAICSSSIDGEVINTNELTVGEHIITCNIDGINTSFDAIVTEEIVENQLNE